MKPSELLRNQFSLSSNELQRYVNSCPHRYKTYNIRKRNGGAREISQPSRDLKIVQRFLIDELLIENLMVHKAATAYRKGRNIVDNARPHLGNQFLLKIDLEEFFPSIKGDDFEKYLSEKFPMEEAEVALLTRIFFKSDNGELKLSIGSPGSPLISNALMFRFDNVISDYADRMNVAYTRYSDDMTFSTNERGALFDWPKMVGDELGRLDYPTLRLNPDKTVFSSKKFNRHVTGITITNEGTASIGRGRKRELRSRLFNVQNLNAEERRQLRGHIAFAAQVEPDFVEKLGQKYANELQALSRSDPDNVDVNPSKKDS